MAGLVTAAIAAAVFGLLAIRATGVYFLMITLALGMVVWGLAFRWVSLTKGDNGIAGVPRPEWGVSVEELRGAFRAFSGRLIPSVTEKGFCLDYCTGQYFPTEYRKAVCAVCAQALWDHFREDFAKSAKEGESAGDAIRRNFRRMFGARIARRWFD